MAALMGRIMVLVATFAATAALKLNRNSTGVAGRRAEFIADPRPQRLADLAGLSGQTAGMNAVSVASPSGSQVTIMTFPSHEDEHVSATLNMGGKWEGQMTQRVYNTWVNECHRKGNFLDVGANIGSWTLPVAVSMAGTHSSVISVEAMPPIADHLRAGIVANKVANVALFPYAVGAPDPANEAQMAVHPKNKGGSAVVGNMPWTESASKYTMGLTTMDAVLQAEPAVANLCYGKFDIEGNEGRMLAGAQALFTSHPPCTAFFELNDDFLRNVGTSRAQIETQLASLGYNVAARVTMDFASFEYKQTNMAACLGRLS